MPKYLFHMGVTLRCYGNVEVEAGSIEAALPLLTADYLAENIDITETTTDSGQDLAVIDVTDPDTGEDLAAYDGLPLPSPYDPQPDAELLAALKALMQEAPFGPATNPGMNWSNSVIEKHRAWVNVCDAIAKLEGRANG